MKCVDLDYCGDISVEKECPRYLFQLHGLRDSAHYREGLKIRLFLCHSEWSLVQKSFSVVSYRPVVLAWQGGILTSDVVFCCCRIF